jgi:hypothetical protein
MPDVLSPITSFLSERVAQLVGDSQYLETTCILDFICHNNNNGCWFVQRRCCSSNRQGILRRSKTQWRVS